MAEGRMRVKKLVLVGGGNMGEGLVAADLRGEMLIFNPAAERLLGGGKVQTGPDGWADAYRICLTDGITPFPTDKLPLVRALTGESVDAVEMYVARPVGAVWLSVSGRPLRDADGIVTGGVAVFGDVSASREAAAEIARVNTRLEKTNGELERLTSEKTLLAELAETLHSCLTLEEAYGAAARTAARLFPRSPGEIFGVNSSRDRMERVARWGDVHDELPTKEDALLEPNDCWAVRTGSVHLAEPDSPSALCKHIPPPVSAWHVCVPIVGQEGTLGVLHLRLAAAGGELTTQGVLDERVLHHFFRQ